MGVPPPGQPYKFYFDSGGSSINRALATSAVALSFALAVPAAATASHQGDAGPQRDFAVGGGFTGDQPSNNPIGAQRVGFAAFGGPTTFDLLTGFGGDPVKGHFLAQGEFVDTDGNATMFQQEGPVTCLAVEGNRARLVYPNKQARPEANEANEVLIVLEDNGNPSNGEPRDRIGFEILPDETPTDDPPSEQDQECVPPQQGTPLMSELTEGNFTIHDATP